MTSELVIFCDGCKAPIGDGQGSLWVDRAEIDRYQEAVLAWEAEVGAGAPKDELPYMTCGQLMDHPDRVRWQAHHVDCDPKIDADEYSVVVDRIRSWPDLVSLTAHLMRKSWLKATDWGAVLDAAARAEGTRVCPLA